MIDEKSIQRALRAMGHYKGAIDGALGRASYAGMRAALAPLATGVERWPASRVLLAFQQLMMRDVGIAVGAIDGLRGPQTEAAFESWQNYLRDKEDDEADASVAAPQLWPRQSQMRAVFGDVGTSQVRIDLPYPLRIAWAPAQTIARMTLHALVAESAKRVLSRVHESYGEQRIRELGLDLFGGSLNVRKMKGGSKWSMHSWGVAIDWDPERNQFRWGRDRAHLARPAYDAFWREWEREGWLSLGRARNFDWMHVQAPRL